MNWKNEAANDLSNYARRKESLENIKEQISIMNFKMTSIKGSTTNSTPVMGGSSQIEDRLLNIIVKKQRLEENYRIARREVNLIEKGMTCLDEKERLVLERFYITRQRGHIERLMDELNYERSRVYQVKDEALYKFTITMYALIDL